MPVLVHADGEPGFSAVTGIHPGPDAAPVVLLPAAREDRRARVQALAVAAQYVNDDVTRKYSSPARHTLGVRENPAMTGF